MSMSNDANPMRKTQAYSFINPDQNTQVRKNEISAIESLSIKDVITLLIEKNLQAWKALPDTVRTALMERPQNFQLIPSGSVKEGTLDYNILYNGTIWRYSPNYLNWSIDGIV